MSDNSESSLLRPTGNLLQPPVDATPIGVYHRQAERKPSSVPIEMFSTADLQQLARDWCDHRGLPIYSRIMLPPEAKIVIAGAYKGKLMALMHEAFPDAHITGFEPQLWAWEQAQDRLMTYQPEGPANGWDQWLLKPYGIAVAPAEHVPLYGFETDACSLHVGTPNSDQVGYGDFEEIGKAFTDIWGPDWRIDLLILNMEGYEFELLPHILQDANICCRIGAVLVQFHLFAAHLTTRLLAGTTYQYGLPRIDAFPQWVLWQYKVDENGVNT